MRVAIALYFLFLVKGAFSQQISAEETLGKPEWDCNEPSISINPKHPDECMIVCNLDHCFHYSSSTQRWIHQRMKSRFGVYGDPVVQFNPNGKLYIVHLSKTKHKPRPDWFDRIVFQSKVHAKKSNSVDIGYNGKMQDKPWISMDTFSASLFQKNLYLTWTQFDHYNSDNPQDSSRILFSRSQDFGKHFSSPIVISQTSGRCLDNDETVEGATSAVDEKGTLYVMWAGHEQLYLNRSKDGGTTWEGERTLMPLPEGWNLEVPSFMRTNGMPFLQYNDHRLYASFAFTNQMLNRVYVSFSENEGDTWSEPFALQKEDSTQYVMPHSKIDPVTGNYYVLYYKIKKEEVSVLLSYKLKKEEGFHTIQVNDKPFVISSTHIFMGDYIGVDAYDGHVRMVWTEALGNHTVIKTRQLRLQ